MYDALLMLTAASAVLVRADDPAARIVGAILEAWLNTPDERTLEAALGCAPGPGRRSLRTRRTLAVRDAALRAAAALLPTKGSSTEQARTLAARLARYHTTAWPRECALPESPSRHHGRIEAHLWAALRAHPRPVCARHMQTILRPRET